MTTDIDASLQWEAETILITRYFDFIRHESGKWEVQLMSEMLSPNDMHYPPGQDFRDDPVDGAWAGKPWFHSYESARDMALGWAKRERQDLLNACIGEAIECRIYRAKQRKKTVE